MDALGLPSVLFHGLRHTHASALIGAGLDVVTVTRRLSWMTRWGSDRLWVPIGCQVGHGAPFCSDRTHGKGLNYLNRMGGRAV